MSPETRNTGGLPALSLSSRLPLLRELFTEADCEAFLITDLVNIRYLTGFSGSAGIVLVLPDETVFVSDGRYGEQAREQLDAAGVEARIEISTNAQKEVLAEAAVGIRRLGLEADAVTWSQQRRYSQEWFPGAELVPTENLVEDLRRIKDEGEVARIEAAAAIADAALDEVRGRVVQEPTEKELALELDFTMRRLGAEDVSFETIVASGPNAAKPHARPAGRTITEGDLVVMDFGALVDGYHSDMTRTLLVGGGSETQRRMLEVVTESQRKGVEAVGPEVECRVVDAVCRGVIEEAGWGEAFVHGTGHGVGLNIHEAPRLGVTSEDVLATGEVVTVEPGVYLPEHGGVRIEDTVVVTPDGCRRLTRSPGVAAVT